MDCVTSEFKRIVSRFSGYVQEGRTSRPDGWQGKYVTLMCIRFSVHVNVMFVRDMWGGDSWPPIANSKRVLFYHCLVLYVSICALYSS